MAGVSVSIVNRSTNPLPQYQTEGSAGADVQAFLAEELVLESGDRALVPTGLYLQIPAGFEVQIRPRSGTAWKKGITILNAPGTIDSDYRGEVRIAIINLSDGPQTIQPGERIAQMVIARHDTALWDPVGTLDETDRGAGGFGHTGE